MNKKSIKEKNVDNNNINKRIVIALILLLGSYLFFKPKYSGFGQDCNCVGYKRNLVHETLLNVVDMETFSPILRGTDTTTTICYGIPYSCELSPGYEVLDSQKIN